MPERELLFDSTALVDLYRGKSVLRAYLEALIARELAGYLYDYASQVVQRERALMVEIAQGSEPSVAAFLAETRRDLLSRGFRSFIAAVAIAL